MQGEMNWLTPGSWVIPDSVHRTNLGSTQEAIYCTASNLVNHVQFTFLTRLLYLSHFNSYGTSSMYYAVPHFRTNHFVFSLWQPYPVCLGLASDFCFWHSLVEPHGVLGIWPGSTTCKANTLPTVLSRSKGDLVGGRIGPHLVTFRDHSCLCA